jgi:hypothetical protein
MVEESSRSSRVWVGHNTDRAGFEIFAFWFILETSSLPS